MNENPDRKLSLGRTLFYYASLANSFSTPPASIQERRIDQGDNFLTL